jgi:NAD(P)H dehydrogenase (quinone)
VDCAAVTVAVLTGHGHYGKSYVVTGPILYTQGELAELFSEVSGRPVRLVELSDQEQVERLRADGVPEPFPRLLTNHLKAIRLGYFDDLTTVVQDLTGRPAQPLSGVLEAHLEEILGARA